MNGPAVAPGGPGRAVEARLAFASAGGRTRLLRQHVPYPFHITRPFHLETARPDLATLYLQSSAGGIYRDDRLRLDVRLGRHAAAHVTTQAATVVHDTRPMAASQETAVALEEDALLVLASDPFILFPGASLSVGLDIALAPRARAIVADGASMHDPRGQERGFARLSWQTRILSSSGKLLALDGWASDGTGFRAGLGPLHGHRAVGSLFVLGAIELEGEPIERAMRAAGCLAAGSPLPNGCGLGFRVLAQDGGYLGRGLDAGTRAAASTFLGLDLARRRK